MTRRYPALFGAAVLGVLASGTVSRAVINTSGDVLPAHNGFDPWSVGPLTIGSTGNGSVFANNGSRISAFETTLGANETGNGQLSVIGQFTRLDTNRDLVVGDLGAGQFDLQFSAIATNQDGILGAEPGSLGVANVRFGARWENSRDLVVGDAGTGILNITDGGVVENDFSVVGDFDGANGSVTVSGSGSRWLNRTGLRVGDGGAGTLRIESGGLVEVQGETFVRRGINLPGGSGSLEFAGGTLQTQDLFVGLTDLSGTGVINTGGLVSDLPLVFDATRGLQQTVTVTDPGTTNVTINVDGSGGASNFGAGYLGQGSLAVRDGVVLPSRQIFAGYHPGASGDLEVRGVGSRIDAQQNVTVGFTGAGTLEIADGAVVNSFSGQLGFLSGSSGVATVTGSGSQWNMTGDLAVGDSISGSSPGPGTGSLTIEQGGQVTTGQTFIASIGGIGSLVVQDPGSRLQTGALVVGFQGDATLTIRNNAVVDASQTTVVGFSAASNSELRFESGGVLNTAGLAAAPEDLVGVGTINTNGLASDVDLRFDADNGVQQQFRWDSEPGQDITINLDISQPTAFLGAGFRSSARLTVADGRVVTTQFGDFGLLPGSHGVAQIEGAGTRFEAQNMTIGREGEGTLLVLDGAVVTGAASNVAGNVGSTGLAVVAGSGSRWEQTGALTVGLNGAGFLNVVSGGAVSAGSVRFGAQQGAMGQATVRGEGSLLETAGDLVLGEFAPGELRVFDEGLVQIGGGVSIAERFGSDPSMIRLHSGGRLALPGQNDSSLFRFLLEIDGSFDAIEFWDGSDWVSLDRSGVRDVDFTLEFQTTGELAGFTVLTVGEVVALPGDYNNDGVVNTADYAVWRDAFGGASSLSNDILAGVVTTEHYDVWRENLGATLTQPLAIPEPASVALMLIAAALARAARQRAA